MNKVMMMTVLVAASLQLGCMGAPEALVGVVADNLQYLDGKDGAPGESGPQGQTGPRGQTGEAGAEGTFDGQVEVIDPCGDDPNHFDEILVLINGVYFATYDSSYLIRLEPGNFVTEDPQRCAFQITNDGEYVE